MRIQFVMAVVAAVVCNPALSQAGPFADYAGHFVEQGLPTEILCPASGFVLFEDGQLLERSIGPNGVETKAGYLCRQDAGQVTCTGGEIANGGLVLTRAADQFKRLSLLSLDTIGFGKLDGSGQPTMLSRCPADFTAMLPNATAADFLTSPPAMIGGDLELTPQTAAASVWGNVSMTPLPDVGVFAFFPRTDQSAAMVEMMANMPVDQIPENVMPPNFDRSELTPERLTELFETEACGNDPKVFTRDGLLLQMSIRESTSIGPFAVVDSVSICGVADGILTCSRTEKKDAGFVPDESKGSFSFGYHPEPEGAAYLCNPDLGRDHPNSCTQPVMCPSSYLDVPVKDLDVRLGDLPNWSPLN